MKKYKKVLAALMLMTAVIMTACNPKDDSNDNDDNGGNDVVDCGGIGTYEGHEYVDLCLPSGTLWATCNVGADAPEGYGDYYAWGEVQTKSHYHWQNYRYCNGNWDQLTKYCFESEYGYEGFTDSLKYLTYEDDYVMLNWANGWRMPTNDQWRELINNTTVEWTTQNGVNGRLFTAENGFSLFLPAAGVLFSYGPVTGEGVDGYYWSDELGQYSINAKAFVFNSSVAFPRDDERYIGYSIRPVHNKL